MGRVGATIEVGERKFELDLFSVGREIALEFERCEGEELTLFRIELTWVGVDSV